MRRSRKVGSQDILRSLGKVLRSVKSISVNQAQGDRKVTLVKKVNVPYALEPKFVGLTDGAEICRVR